MADDLFSLARDLGEVPQQTARPLRQAVEITARKIKDQIRSEYSGSRGLPAAGRSVTYDMHGTNGARLGAISAEIGPELGGQGSLVGLVDTGSVNNPGKKRIPKALADNAEDFDRGIDRAIADGLRAAGL